ncbi:hypothetical protein BX616_003966, partial [Lobosporangium transversale]
MAKTAASLNEASLPTLFDPRDNMLAPAAMSLANPLLAAAAPIRPEECPPCFNCQLDAFPCSHFAPCNSYDGLCTCPPGFAGNNCSEP